MFFRRIPEEHVSFFFLVAQHGEQWKKDSCTTCRCERGEPRCLKQTCAPLTCEKVMLRNSRRGLLLQSSLLRRQERLVCSLNAISPGSQGEIRVQHPGKCCEECLSPNGSCVHQGTVRSHGAIWNSSHCEFCMCERRQVACWSGECAKVECGPVRQWLHF